MKKHFLSDIVIVDDYRLIDTPYTIPASLEDKIDEYYYLANSGKKSAIKKLESAIKKYPNVPLLMNFLSVLYEKLDKYEKARELTEKMYKKFPDYLYGRINYAGFLINEGKLDKIPELLGKKLFLTEVFPNRKVYDVFEMVSYLKVTIKYLIRVDINEAKKRMLLLEEYGDEGDIQEIQNEFLAYFLENSDNIFKDMLQGVKYPIRITPPKPDRKPVSFPPQFHHNEISEILYKTGIIDFSAQIDKILSLPRETLIKDLELVLMDSIDNQDVYLGDDYQAEHFYFVFHAVMILGDLKSYDSLPYILETLHQDDFYTDTFYGYLLTETLFEPIYKLSDKNIELLTDFICKKGVDTYSKLSVLSALEQLYIYHPEFQDELKSKLEIIIKCFAKARRKSNLIDTTVIAELIMLAAHMNLIHLIPVIQRFFEKEQVDKFITGDLKGNELLRFFKEETTFDKRKILSIKERYLGFK